jgi:hypothetical protein
MSTSPSWFDKEKFSRLVKKVGTKTVSDLGVGTPVTEPESRSVPAPVPVSPPAAVPESSGSGETAFSGDLPQAPTAHISLVSRPPSLLSEHRALPALPRRTMPLPALKSLFPYTGPAARPTPPTPVEPPADIPTLKVPPPMEPPPAEAKIAEPKEKEPAKAPAEDKDEMAAAWQKMGQLNDELAHAILERDQAINEGILLREQLRQVDETLEQQEKTGASTEELARIGKERDAAVAEANGLRDQLRKANEEVKSPEPSADAKEVVLLTGERDQARKEYAKLREQFEVLKQEQAPPKEDSAKFRKELEQQLEGFRLKLEERNREIAALKANPPPAGSDEAMEKLRMEVISLREQQTRSKEETSIAQRGLALSQKALHETRDTLREATEGTSLSRHNFDNLKNECATLVQQNTVLQAQNEQLTRDLNAAKSKLTTRL